VPPGVVNCMNPADRNAGGFNSALLRSIANGSSWHLGEATRSLDLEVVIEELHHSLGEIAGGFNRRYGSTLRHDAALIGGASRLDLPAPDIPMIRTFR